MDKRQEKLSELQTYIEGVDKEVTMILQSLQWDRKHILEGTSLVQCQYDHNHRVPPDKKQLHEEECFIRSQGYARDVMMLPAPFDYDAPTLVRLSNEDITQIINQASQADPSFKRGPVRSVHPPLTAERMQWTYTLDERRALYDAVVNTAPDEALGEDWAIAGTSEKGKKRPKSKMEVLAELRDMRRRRTKYRGASVASRNYSNVLRDVIKSQMELFGCVKEEPENPGYKTMNDKQDQFNYKHNNDPTDNGKDMRGKKDEHRMERYDERSSSRDRAGYDRYKEKHRQRDDRERTRDKEHHRKHSDRYTKHEKYIKQEKESPTRDFYGQETNHSSSRSEEKRRDERNSDEYRKHERYIKKEKESPAKEDFYEQENGDSSARSKEKRRGEDERKTDKYSSRERSRGSGREKSYKYRDSSHASGRNKEDQIENYEDHKNKRNPREQGDRYKEHKSKRRDKVEYPYETKRS